MSTDAGDGTTVRHGQPFLTCVVVAVGVVVGWIAYEHWWMPHLLDRAGTWPVVRDHFWALNLSYMAVLYAPFVLVLLIWGRTMRRRLAAALVGVAVIGYRWGLYEVFSNLVWPEHGNTPTGEFRVYVWLDLLVTPLLVALAWGIARRWGRVWPLGLVVAPVLAAVIYELGLHSSWWRHHFLYDDRSAHWWVHDLVAAGPAALAAVVCWLIDSATTRRTPSGPAPDPQPEMQSSA